MPSPRCRSSRFPSPNAGHCRRRDWLRTVHHGLPADLLEPRAAKPDYLAFLGRIAPEKAVDRAIRIAQRCKLPLKIAAKVDRADRDYFEREIRPLLDLPGIDYIGEIGDKDKSAFLSGAMALLMPIDWPEPFGLVMIEAMACGTPVIAYGSGSVPEVVEHGLTGFIVDSEAAAAAAIDNQLSHLSRHKIRARFEERFTARRMAERLCRDLSRVDRRQQATAADSQWLGETELSSTGQPSSNWHRWWTIYRGLRRFRGEFEWSIRGPRAMSA